MSDPDYERQLQGRMQRLQRYYSQFIIEPWGLAEDAAWRLGGPAPPNPHITLFSDAIGAPLRANFKMQTSLAVTNLYRPNQLAGAMDLHRWFLRLSREVDDPLRWFLGTCTARFTYNQYAAAETPLLHLLGDGQPFVLEGQTRLHVRDGLRVEVEVVVAQQDGAFAEYSAHLRKQDPPRLAGWIYLEGIEYLRIP